MRVVKRTVNRVRREVAQVFLRQLAQRADERTRFLHDLCCKGVSLIFVAPRPRVQQRREPEREDTCEQTEQQQRRSNVARLKCERAIKPILFRQFNNAKKPVEEKIIPSGKK